MYRIRVKAQPFVRKMHKRWDDMGFLSLLSWLDPKRVLMLGAAILVGVLLWQGASFIDEKYQLENEVFRQEVVLAQNEITINGLRVELDLATEAALRAEQILEQERLRAVEIEQARQRALSVAPEDNGAVAPVLLDGLDVIRERINR